MSVQVMGDSLDRCNMVKKIVLVLLYICLGPLIVAIVVPTMIVVAALAAYGWAALRWQSWHSGTWFYLVCSPQRGWNEFLVNNLLAALPPGVAPIWTERKTASSRSLAMQSLLTRGTGLTKPYLAKVTPLRIRARSLHEQLLPLKAFGRKDEQVQQLLRRLLETELCS